MAEEKVKKKRTRRGGPNARGEMRRKELIDSAEALLTKNLIQDVSYTDIAEMAGMPLPACYHFYKNQLELLQAVSERLGQRYREEVIEAELRSASFECWEDLVDQLVDRSAAFVGRYPASIQVWYSIYAPPFIRARTSERERGLAASFKALLEQHFVMPEIPHLDTIFYVFFEAFDRIFTISYTAREDSAFYREESKRLGKIYLRCYLPEFLPLRETK